MRMCYLETIDGENWHWKYVSGYVLKGLVHITPLDRRDLGGFVDCIVFTDQKIDEQTLLTIVRATREFDEEEVIVVDEDFEWDEAEFPQDGWLLKKYGKTDSGHLFTFVNGLIVEWQVNG